MRKKPETLESGGQQPKPFTNGAGPLSNPNAFIQHTFPMMSPFVQAAVDTLVRSMGNRAIPGAPYTVKKGVSEVRGNEYTAFPAQMDNRPVMVFRRNGTNEHYVVPTEQLTNPLHFIFGPRVRSLFTEEQSPAGGASPAGGQTTPEQQQPGGASPAGGQTPQQQQQPLNLFEYMSKLPPNERMLYTLLIYMLLSDAISSVFGRGRSGGQAQSVPQQVGTSWIPGPPRGSQWMIWG